MSRFGWAYVSSLITGAVANGPTNSIQFNSGSQILSGSDSFTFDPSTTTVTLTGTLVVDGTLFATEYQTTLVSSSIIYSSGSTKFGDDAGDTHQFTGSILGDIVSGTIAQFSVISASVVSASSYVNVLASAGGPDEAIQFNSGSAITGSSDLVYNYTTNTLSGTVAEFTTITGSFITSSIGEFETLSASNSLVSNITTIGNYAQFLPVNTTIPSNITASYIYTSGSTNDLYFQQYDPSTGLTNSTRFRWLEGAIGTGLLYGGTLSTVNGTTTFNVSAGNALVVNFNATTASDPYPTTTFVEWSNFVSQSLTYSGSAQITFIAIDISGNLVQSTSPFTSKDRKENIVLGRILHQTGSVTNGSINEPNTGYAYVPNTRDFFRSFGPLKVTGHTLQTSGSTLGLLKTEGSSYAEGRNYLTDPNSPNFIESTSDPALTDAKIYREYVSGSTYIIDTGIANAGYAVIDPTLYNNNGTLTSVSPSSKFTIQRVYWFPNSVNRALFVYYGNQIYDSIASAVDAVSTEQFTEGLNTQTSAIYVGSIIVAGNATNLTNTSEAKIIQGGLFRNVGGGGGGGSTTPGGSTTQIQYNDGGAFNGSSNFTFDNVTSKVSITGSLVVSGTTENSFVVSSASPALKVTQQGTGLSFVVEDQTGPDPTPFAITATGDVGIGTAVPTDKLHVVGSIKGTTTITGVTGVYTVVSSSILSSSLQTEIGGNAIIAGSVIGSQAIKGGYATYSSNFTASAASYFVGVDSTGGVITASLDSATNYLAGQTMYFKDIGGNAGTNNIRIQPSGSQTIDGAAGGVVLANNSGSITLVSNGTDQFYIVGLT